MSFWKKLFGSEESQNGDLANRESNQTSTNLQKVAAPVPARRVQAAQRQLPRRSKHPHRG